MKRRALLRAVGAAGGAGTTALAGCGAILPQATAEIVDVDDVPETYGVSIDVELLRSRFTEDRPARLETTVTNHDSRKQLSASGDAMCCLFNRQKAESDPSGLWLHPPRSAEEIARKNGKWVRDRDADRLRAFLQYACSLATYVPDESRSQAYDIWDDYRSDGYLTTGTYRWDVAVDVAGPEEGRGDADSFEWGFSLELS